jgi:DNA polymerase III subunit delta'
MPAPKPGIQIAPPRASPVLLGHEATEARVQRWIAEGRLPHALLICGPWGIGKATLAFRIARLLLGAGAGGQGALAPGADPERWVVAGTHPDLLTIERKFDERRGRVASEIVVDDVRRIGALLGTSPAVGGWRVVIIDAADEMNRNAGNALLKVLEEPGDKSLIMLVAHRPALLPATVRSRCRRLLLGPLSDDILATLLRRLLPELGEEEAALLGRLAEGSLGRALLLAQHDGLAAFRTFGTLFGALAAGDRRTTLPRIVEAGAGDEDAFQVTMHVLSWWLRQIARAGAAPASAHSPQPGSPIEQAEAAAGRLAGALPLDRWLQVWEKTQHLLAQAAAGNLDRKQAMVTALLSMHCELQPS